MAGDVMISARDEAAAVIALLRTMPTSATRPQLLRDLFESGDALATWVDRQGGALTLDVTAGADPLTVARHDLDVWTGGGIGVATVMSPDYPSRLLAVPQAPLVLFHRGELRAHDRAIAVVGSRAASDRGRAIAAHAARVLTAADITVVSGLAEGIDTAAHEAALAAGGRTVAVLGTGIRRSYPAANAGLQHRICADGLVLSQFWPDAGPTRQSFPMRNVTMCGYSLATIIVEASEKSGTRHQAFAALDQSRALIMTDLVVESTSWGRTLVGRPHVHVAASAADLEDHVQMVVQRQGRVVDARALADA